MSSGVWVYPLGAQRASCGSDCDDDLASPMSLVGVAEDVRCLAQRAAVADDRCQLAGFDPRNSILGYEDIPERLFMAAVGAR